MSSILSKNYKCITATNGKDGLEKINVELPDMIVSDVMMCAITTDSLH